MKNSYIGAIVVIIILGGIWLYMQQGSAPAVEELPVNTYGMTQYSDATYGFTFWYPNTVTVTASTTNDALGFPGGISVKQLRVGDTGDINLYVIESPDSTITDEPSGHASPIAQTKYFYDSASSTWMTAFPDSAGEGSSRSTTTADVSKTTMGGLPMLQSGRRFNTTIIPLSTTRFLVVTDGGGGMYTNELAKTVAKTGTTVSPAIQASILQAEATASSAQ